MRYERANEAHRHMKPRQAVRARGARHGVDDALGVKPDDIASLLKRDANAAGAPISSGNEGLGPAATQHE
jgi:hypothetical protein